MLPTELFRFSFFFPEGLLPNAASLASEIVFYLFSISLSEKRPLKYLHPNARQEMLIVMIQWHCLMFLVFQKQNVDS